MHNSLTKAVPLTFLTFDIFYYFNKRDFDKINKAPPFAQKQVVEALNSV
jgi:hypothetical protein